MAVEGGHLAMRLITPMDAVFRWIGALYCKELKWLQLALAGGSDGVTERRQYTASDEMTGSENVKSAPEDAFVALASQHGYFLHPLEIFM